MANITIRDLPNQTKEALRVQAAQCGISLEAYARHILQSASKSYTPNPDILKIADRYFGADGGIDLPLPDRSSRRNIPDFSE